MALFYERTRHYARKLLDTARHCQRSRCFTKNLPNGGLGGKRGKSTPQAAAERVRTADKTKSQSSISQAHGPLTGI